MLSQLLAACRLELHAGVSQDQHCVSLVVQPSRMGRKHHRRLRLSDVPQQVSHPAPPLVAVYSLPNACFCTLRLQSASAQTTFREGKRCCLNQWCGVAPAKVREGCFVVEISCLFLLAALRTPTW